MARGCYAERIKKYWKTNRATGGERLQAKAR